MIRPARAVLTLARPTRASSILSNSALRLVADEHSVTASQVPVDMVTASGSGLDPEISPLQRRFRFNA